MVKSGRIDLPEDADVADFLLADSKVIKHGSSKLAADSPPLQSLKSTFDAFFASIPEGNLEATTLDGMHRHERHLLRILRADFPIPTLTGEHLQRYVNCRCKDKTHFGTLVSAATIHKELVTLGTVWRWAELQTRQGLEFPKLHDGFAAAPRVWHSRGRPTL